jgi:hypothetical protein
MRREHPKDHASQSSKLSEKGDGVGESILGQSRCGTSKTDRSRKQLYTTTAVLASPQSAIKTGKFCDVSEMTSLKNFVTSFAGHIAAEAAR